MRQITVSQHAVDRLCEHHPGSTEHDVIIGICEGQRIDAEMVQAVTQRAKGRRPNHSTYVLSRDNRGVFVLDRGGRVVTYLRLHYAATEALVKPKPAGTPPDPQPEIVGTRAQRDTAIHKINQEEAEIARCRRQREHVQSLARDLYHKAESIERMAKRIIKADSLEDLQRWALTTFGWLRDWLGDTPPPLEIHDDLG